MIVQLMPKRPMRPSFVMFLIGVGAAVCTVLSLVDQFLSGVR